MYDFIAIGDIVTDAFIELENDEAEVEKENGFTKINDLVQGLRKAVLGSDLGHTAKVNIHVFLNLLDHRNVIRLPDILQKSR